MTGTQHQSYEPLAAAELAKLQEFCANTAIARAEIEILSASATSCSARMPVAGNTQPLGLLHGGASALLAESVASIAAHLYAQPEAVAVGTDLSITHLGSARTGFVTATATALHLGRSTAVYRIEIVDEAARQIADARLSCRILPNTHSTPQQSH